MKHYSIQPANLEFNAEGTPVSRDFDDVYFSNDNGLEETRYVFLGGNQLEVRFPEHPHPLFVVAESGFGTGLNFLTLWQAFDQFREAHPQAQLQRLHFISFEKFPLTRADLALAHQHWPELAPWAEQLQAQWPMPLPGCHRLLLDEGRVTLDLWFGDINELTSQLDDSLNQKVDAWFLDGFAPAKNPDMWTQNLFNAMARLARPGGTLATFTSAGFVRRGLQDAGFTMQKRKGFGRKREMLCGVMEQTLPLPCSAPWFNRTGSSKREAAIIGGGIASALLSLALLRRGWQVTLYCADEAPALGASGNRQGALYPLLSKHDEALNRFFSNAFTFARRFYDQLPVKFDHDWCGVTQLGWDEKSQHKIAQMLSMDLPAELAVAVEANAVEQITGVATNCSGITYPQGGWLCPAELTRNVLELAQQQGLQIYYQYQLQNLSRKDDCWLLNFAGDQQATHSVVVLANGHQISRFSQTSTLPVYSVAGQVSHIPTTPELAELKQVLCYDGYLTPQNPANQHHCIGASYHRGSEDTAYSEDDQQQNRQRLIDCFPQAQWAKEVDVSDKEARCGVRCATRDHLPMVGNVPDYEATLVEYASLAEQKDEAVSAPVFDDLFMFAALGSRGLCSAPLCAEILAAQMSDEPIPMDASTLAALNPNRLWVRMGKAVIAIHGGAGAISRAQMSLQQELRYIEALSAIVETGQKMLEAGESALDVVTEAVRLLEECPLFNAGIGAVFTRDETHELDACVMDGNTLKAGAVAGVSHLRNPVLAARLVMEQSPHVMMIGEGAENFAFARGMERVSPEIFSTSLRYEQLLAARKEGATVLDHSGAPLDEKQKMGTVGAVALDLDGNLAAATSTGGMTNKLPGRVGDSPLVGAGCYANNASVAVSCTGTGEVFIRALAAYDIAALMDYGGLSLAEACERVVMEKLPALGGSGGLIAIDHEGNVALPFNTEGMYRAWGYAGDTPTTGIYREKGDTVATQ